MMPPDVSKATPRRAIPTPYDAEETKYQDWLNEHGGEDAPRTPLVEWHHTWRLGGAEGYRKAKTEDATRRAELTAALEVALAHIAQLHQTDQALFACETADMIRAALAKVRGEEV